MTKSVFVTLPSYTLLCLVFLLASCAKPMANFTYNQQKLAAPSKTTFSNNSVKATTYTWDFGDGQTSNELNPTHEYAKPGVYTITLTAQKGKRKNTMSKEITLEASKDCLVEIETDFGTMVVELYNSTPQHRDNFLKLAEEGYYNDLIFHRVINGFMIQGGDPQSRNAKPGVQLGSGGPSYTVPAEFVDTLFHVKGALAAARTGDQMNPEKRSSGSQFYIVQGRPVTEQQLNQMEAQKGFRYSTEQRNQYLASGGVPFLDREYTVFGRVISGLEVIDKIAVVPTERGDRPKSDVKMKIRVIH